MPFGIVAGYPHFAKTGLPAVTKRVILYHIRKGVIFGFWGPMKWVPGFLGLSAHNSDNGYQIMGELGLGRARVSTSVLTRALQIWGD